MNTPVQQQNREISKFGKEPEEDDLQRLPSELQPRPKIPRTPEGGQRPVPR